MNFKHAAIFYNANKTRTAPLGEEVLALEMRRIERLYRNMMEART